MQTQDDYSYGIIPFIKEDGIWKVFLINQYGSAGDVYWTFPKGHAEKDETPIQAALRELYEETSITLEQLIDEKTYQQEYSFKYEQLMINKVVIYYAGWTRSPKFAIQDDEVKEAGWFTHEEARKLLTFEYAKTMIDTAMKDIESVTV